MALNIIEDNAQCKPVAVFTDNQAAIRAIQNPKQQSGQYILVQLARRIQELNTSIHVHWIPAHKGIPGNEAADMAAKEATGWRKAAKNGPPITLQPEESTALTSAVKGEVKTRAIAQWTQAWAAEKHGRTTYRLTKVPSREVLQKFKNLSRAVIVQARTEKIGLRDYLHRIGVEDSPECPCGARRQTVKHTLLECPGFEDIRGDELVSEKDPTKLLGTPALAAKVAKSLLATGELYQFRYTHGAQVQYPHRRDRGGRQLVEVEVTPRRERAQSLRHIGICHSRDRTAIGSLLARKLGWPW